MKKQICNGKARLPLCCVDAAPLIFLLSFMGISENFLNFYEKVVDQVKKIAQQVEYIKPGDTVGSLARKFRVSEEQIFQLNEQKDPNIKGHIGNVRSRVSALRIGEALKIPESPLSFSQKIEKMPMDQQIRSIAEWAGLDPKLFAAVIYQESKGDPNAVSHAGAQGLGQLMPEISEQFGIDAFHPTQNLTTSAVFLSQQIKRAPGNTYHEKVWHGLMRYNWGGPNFESWWRSGGTGRIPKETLNYAYSIFTLLNWPIPQFYELKLRPGVSKAK